MVKILQVFGSLEMAGAESRMMEVYRHIDREAFHFDFLVLTLGKQFFETEVNELGGKIFKLEMPSAQTIFRHISAIREILRTEKYDVVHAHTSYHCGIVMYAAWREKVSVRISHARTTGSKRKGCFRIWASIIGKWLVRLWSTHCLAISQDAGIYLFGHKQFEVLPNAIDLDKFQNVTAAEVNACRARYKMPANAFVIGQVGRFEPMKNHAFTLRWFQQFHQKYREAFLVLVGDGSQKKFIEELAEELQLHGAICFTGVVGKIEILLQTFDVLFFPSIYEGLGGVVLEAQAAGIPAVISASLPKETDLGLGLVTRCSLNDSLESWNQAVKASRTTMRPSCKEILRAFDMKKYSLRYELQRLQDIYNNKNKV